MEHLKKEVIFSANRLYQSFIEHDMSEGIYPHYKASGMAYIRFAREKKELFKLLFMRDRRIEEIKENREEISDILEIIKVNLGFDEEKAYLFHLELWLYVRDIATMIATAYLEWDLELISRALSDAYEGLRLKFTKE